MDLILFTCPTYKARLTLNGCADMRKRPLLNDKSDAVPEGKERLHRHPSCNDDCPHLLAQQNTTASPPATAWDRISAATGLTSHSALAKELGCWQSQVSHIFRMVIGKGKRPQGDLWARIVKRSGLTEDEILGRTSAPTAEHAPDHIVNVSKMVPTAEPMPGQAPPVIVHGDKVPPTMMGTDPADALINTEQAQELLDSAESPPAPGSIASIVGGMIATEAEEQLEQAGQDAAIEHAELRSAVNVYQGGVPTPGTEVLSLVQEALESTATTQPPIEPDLDGWEFYDPHTKPADPAVWITKDNLVCINADAVRTFNLKECAYVRLGLHRSTRKVCLLPVDFGSGALSLQVSKDRGCRYVSGKGFLDRHSLNPVRNKPFTITSGPGGMLVITIEMQAVEQLEEAS